MPTTAIILLAAGNSSRLGRPKQLVRYRGSVLLRHTAQTALDAALGPVTVVLGAAEEQCRKSLDGMPVHIVSNPRWSEGMGTSISAGMQKISESEHQAVIIMLCDQPAITPEMLRLLVEHQRNTGESIVISRHGEVFSPPVLFVTEHFSELRLLRGHQGAKSLFQHRSDVAFVPCAEAAFDIDTEEDLILLRDG